MNASNTVILIGRLCEDPEVRWTQGQPPQCVARYRLAVDRSYTTNGKREADFVQCVAWRKAGEFADKYLHKGMKIAVGGEIRTGSYQRQDGSKAYTTEVYVDTHSFCESAAQNNQPNNYKPAPQQPVYRPQQTAQQDYQQMGFMDIPDGVDHEGLPFN
jgi:single-strand DNA-binding protein